jgi:hypothetical protein
VSRAHIHRCIAGCLRAKDGRGIWHNTHALEQRLLAEGSTPTIAHMTAKAAASVAQAIREAAARGSVQVQP